MDRGSAAMMQLLKALMPVLLLTALFVAAVFLIKHIIHRLVDHK
jgi:hypothetical protein